MRVNYAESRLYFAVEDTGQGVAQDEIDTLFVPFHQSHRQKTTEKGTGLGLAISQSFVQLMGGSRLSVSSELGKGSIFRFDIPIEVSSEQDQPIDVISKRVKVLAQGQPTPRILVADDHVDSRHVLVSLLRLVGFDVQEAVDGTQAVDAALD